MRHPCLASFVLAACVSAAGAVEPPAVPVFSYQGVLNDGGQPYNGTADITLRLWDSLVGGVAATSPVNYLGRPVTDGLFTVTPNFGSAAFNGDARYLEIIVNGVTLSPRQPVTYAPQALQTRGMYYNESMGFMGVGRKNPLTGAEVFGIHREGTGFGGMYVSTPANGLPFYGYSVDGGTQAYHYYQPNDGSWRLRNGAAEMVYSNGGDLELGSGSLGVGSSSPFYPIEARTTGKLITIYSENSVGSGAAVSAYSTGSNGVGVYGSATGTFGRGVKGVTNVSNGVGVQGEANGTGGTAIVAFANGTNSRGLVVQATAPGTMAADLIGYVALEDDVSIGTNFRQNRLLVRGSTNTLATPSGHVAMIENTTTGTSPDVLGLKINSSDLTPGVGVNYITFFNDADASLGSIQGNNAGGVEFAGPGNDYAEWLEQESESEVFEPGDVVAVRGGKITLDTRGADQTMVVSTSPIVTGNRPFEDDEGIAGWQKIAFVGQAPVRVVGRVNAGDFLLPSGFGDGTAVAVSAGEIDPATLTQILGVAWESSQEVGVKRVKAAIGVDQADANAHVIRVQHERLRELGDRVERLEKLVEGLSPAAP